MAVHTRTLFDSDGDNTAQACKTSAGDLHYIHIVNTNSADAYLQLFDVAAASVTVGTTTPKLTFLVPAGNGTDAGGFTENFELYPLHFEAAITYSCTTTATGNGDPTTGLTVNLVYR